MWKTNVKVLLVTLVVIGFYTVIANAIPQLESEVPESLDLSAGVTPEALVAAGERVYHGAGGCTSCHGLGTRAPNLLTDQGGEGPIGARCGSREPGKDCKAYLWESLTEPGKFIVPGFENIMPDQRRQLPEDQLWAAVAYLQSLGGEVTVTAEDVGPSPASSSSPSSPARSTTTDPRQLLTENGCLGCHALDGAGPPIGPSFDGIGRRVNADRIRRGILDPNADTAQGFAQFAGTMPQTFGQQLSAAQLEALVTFLAGRR
jgi:mono/diheme cytochrome c family protein